MNITPLNSNKAVSSVDIYKFLGYKEHRHFKRLISSHVSQLNQFGDVRVSVINNRDTKGGRPSENYLLNINHLFYLVGLSKNTKNGNKEEVLKVLIQSYASASVVAIYDLIASLDIDEDNQDKYVYVAKESVSGRYKIGISKNPEARVKALNTGNPEQLKLVHAYLATDDGYKSESLAHAIFEEERLLGEWFDKTIDLNLLPSYNAVCREAADCDCLECSNNIDVSNAVDHLESASRDEFISTALKGTELPFDDVAKHIDALEDLGVIEFR